MSSNRRRLAAILASLAGLAAVGAATATQAQAWTVTTSVDSSCGKDGNVLLTGVFTNNESTKDINVTMVWTSLSDGPRLVAHQQGGQFQIDTGVTSLPAGNVKFNETWASGTGSDSKSASFVAADCASTQPVTGTVSNCPGVYVDLTGAVPGDKYTWKDTTTTFHNVVPVQADASGHVHIVLADKLADTPYKAGDVVTGTVYDEVSGTVPVGTASGTIKECDSGTPTATATATATKSSPSPKPSVSSSIGTPTSASVPVVAHSTPALHASSTPSIYQPAPVAGGDGVETTAAATPVQHGAPMWPLWLVVVAIVGGAFRKPLLALPIFRIGGRNK